MEKPYYFKFDDEGQLKGVYKRLSDNPDYESIKKFIQFYIIWQLDIPANQKSAIGIYFATDQALNDAEKIMSFGKQFGLENSYEFYDKDEQNTLNLNRITHPFLLEEDTDKLKEILTSDWKLFGSILLKNTDFWELLKTHVVSHKKVIKE